jgi:hypothetical protein
MTWLRLGDQFNSREYHEGTVLENRLGLQIARALVANARVKRAIRERVRDSDPMREALERDGAVRVPNFLPQPVFQAIRSEFTAARDTGLLVQAPCVEDNALVEDTVAIGKNRRVFPVAWREFGENQALRELVGHVIGRTPDGTSLLFSRMYKSDEPVTPTRLIGSNYIHADIHFPTIKAWLYLNDIDETNGATVFAPGSHRMTLARLTYEYEASIRVARATAHGEVRTAVPYGLLRMPRADQLERMDIKEVSMCGSANTLLIANTMGFHRRGEFVPGKTRDLLMIRFGDRGSKKRKDAP